MGRPFLLRCTARADGRTNRIFDAAAPPAANRACRCLFGMARKSRPSRLESAAAAVWRRSADPTAARSDDGIVVMAATEQMSSAKRALLEKLSRGDAALQSREAPLEPRPAGAAVPLAPDQNLIWLSSQMAGQQPAYNEPVTIHY